jgi:hypothetical protein
LDEAIAKLRCGIRFYNESIGVKNTDSSGYHETITVFWATLVFELLEHLAPNCPPESCVSIVTSTFAGKSALWREYYSFDIMRSKEARTKWIAPDLKPLTYPHAISAD